MLKKPSNGEAFEKQNRNNRIFVSTISALDTVLQSLCLVVDDHICGRPVEMLTDEAGVPHVNFQHYVDATHKKLWGDAAPQTPEEEKTVVPAGATDLDDVHIFGGA